MQAEKPRVSPKIGCVSAKQTRNPVCFALDLHYLCSPFPEAGLPPTQKGKSKRESTMGKTFPKTGGNAAFHVLALCIVAVWGTTFVSTKLLLGNGLNPQEIFFYRFSLAYLLMLAYYHKRLFSDNWKDELRMICAGMMGGSLYFYTENTALEYTASTNIALILCIAPLLTALLIRLFYKDLRSGWNRNFLLGSLIALIGVSLVILNGHFVFHLSPKGDLLCLASACCWALYTVLLKDLEKRYDTFLITRKVFFYGILTIFPLYIAGFEPSRLQLLTKPLVWGNLLYLGLVASLLCFLFWNVTLKKINPIRATNYIYFSPVVTAIASFFILGEPITWIIVCGGCLIISGVYLSGKKKICPRHEAVSK